LHLDLLVKAIV